MNRQIQPAPVRRTVTVKAGQARAFEVFTANIGRWWPRSHHIGQAELDTITIEGREGGRWFERGVDGTECDIGRVLTWQPPSRVVLGWQLTAEWRFDPELVTEVEVNFIPEGPGQTRVELEHRNLERFGDRAEAVRGQIDAPSGWTLVLQQFVESANA
jgi:uncharacterized protein YndB with AHSA1/START domain